MMRELECDRPARHAIGTPLHAPPCPVRPDAALYWRTDSGAQSQPKPLSIAIPMMPIIRIVVPIRQRSDVLHRASF
jgi:hypothetical protein